MMRRAAQPREDARADGPAARGWPHRAGVIDYQAPRKNLSRIWHQFYDALRFVGLRDRLRCPSCSSVGTWKPHGGWFDVEDKRKVRRWLCKWCGYYVGPEGQKRALVQPDFGRVWELQDRGTTPKDLSRGLNPWSG
jgi:hypothetical protein